MDSKVGWGHTEAEQAVKRAHEKMRSELNNDLVNVRSVLRTARLHAAARKEWVDVWELLVETCEAFEGLEV